MPISRRTFLRHAAAGTGMACSVAAAGVAAVPARPVSPVCVFTKPFCHLPFDELARRIAGLGFDGLEAPIRKGGHVEPEAVPDKLPELVDVLGQHNLVINIMASDINDADDPVTQQVLQTAADLGIRFYRMKYFKYDESLPIRPQLTDFRKRLINLAALNKELGVTALYQNHAGRNYFGAGLWDLHIALEGVSAESVGVAYDIRHATAEAGMSWPVNLRLLLPHVRAVYVKDFEWMPARHAGAGKSRAKAMQNVPLGTGRVSESFFEILKQADFQGPLSLHEEYLDHRDPELTDQHCEAIERDLAQLRRWWKA